MFQKGFPKAFAIAFPLKPLFRKPIHKSGSPGENHGFAIYLSIHSGGGRFCFPGAGRRNASRKYYPGCCLADGRGFEQSSGADGKRARAGDLAYE